VRRAALVLLALAVSTGLVACGGSSKPSAAEAKQNLCGSLNDFAASVVSLQGVVVNPSQDAIKSALDDIQASWDKVVADAEDVKSANTDNIQSTYDDLKKAVQNRPTNKPVTQQLSGLSPQLTAFAEAWKQFASSLDCKSSS
jgi:gamma-glutamyl:cysteine ligase YbdK (ATP-grasp superfamily)